VKRPACERRQAATSFDLDDDNEAVTHATANGGPFKMTGIAP
jgi:hypothetical protein